VRPQLNVGQALPQLFGCPVGSERLNHHRQRIGADLRQVRFSGKDNAEG
jgi:hypothetical protein